MFQNTSNTLDYVSLLLVIIQGWSYKIEANFVEIYNEEIRDLLATEKGLKHEIKRVDAKSSEIYVTNLKVCR